jgi:uncharacterized protein (DUF433 family)
MIATPVSLDVPLRVDEAGAIRIGQTRVLLEIVVGAYLRGDSPEQIVKSYDVLKLDQVYAVIAYYLSHSDEVDDYMRQVEAAGEEIRRKFEALPGYTPLTRAMLLERLEAKNKKGEDADFENQVRYVPLRS